MNVRAGGHARNRRAHRDFGIESSRAKDGRELRGYAGDTLASALLANGIHLVGRSFKYHRRRGLYCVTGDCPNCMVNIDGEACMRSCVVEATPGQRVRRERGWPSADRDLFGVDDEPQLRD